MNKIKSHAIISTLFIFLFLSYTPPLFHYPNSILPGMDELIDNLYNNSNEIKEVVGIKNKSKSDLKAELLQNLRISYFKQLFFIFFGLLAGILLLFKKRIGRYLVLAISLFMVGSWLYRHFIKENHWEYLQVKFTMFFQAYPKEVIHYDIAANIIYLTAIIFLLLPSTAKEFNIKQGQEIKAT